MAETFVKDLSYIHLLLPKSFFRETLSHKVHINIYRVPQYMSLRWNWNSPTPSLASECAPPPRTKGGGGAHSPAGMGLGESQFRRLKEKLSTLPTLWPVPLSKRIVAGSTCQFWEQSAEFWTRKLKSEEGCSQIFRSQAIFNHQPFDNISYYTIWVQSYKKGFVHREVDITLLRRYSVHRSVLYKFHMSYFCKL